MATWELALTMAFVVAVSGGIIWWQVAAFDRKYGKQSGAGPKLNKPKG